MDRKIRVAAIGDNCIDYYDSLNESYPGGNPVNVDVYKRQSMVCGTRHQTGNFLQLGKKAASERLCGFASVNRTQL